MSVIQNDYFELAADTTPQLGGTLDGNGHSIEDTPIGAVTPSEGNFTDLEVTGSVQSDIDFGGNYALQLQNIPDLAAKGEGYWFDGIDGKITVLNDDNLNFGTGDFSIIASFKALSQGAIIEKRLSGAFGTQKGYGMRVGSGGKILLIMDDATNYNIETFDKDIIDGVHHKCGIVFDRSANASCYIDGVNIGEVDISAIGDISSTADLTIGARGTDTYINMDNYAELIFNMALTAAEMKALTNGAPVPYKYLGASQTNWVVNGGFETDIATPPNQWVNSGNQVGSSIADGTAPEGSNALEIVSSGVGDNGANNVYSSPSGKTIMGKHYRLQFKAKSISGNTSLHAHRHTDAAILTGDWAEYTQEFVKTESGYTRGAYMWLEGVGVARVDDVRLTQMGCVAQYEQDGICHNQWIDKSGNKLHGEVSGGSPTNLSPSHKEQYPHLISITGNTAWTDVVPAGYILNYIVFEGENANAATIDLGTAASTSNVFSQEVIVANNITIVVINKMFSKTVAQSLYLNDAGAGAWNGASLLATLYMSRVEV